jgi:hypothetical protein
MTRTDIPPHVRELILRHIESVQQVEILALLSRSPERSWDTAAIRRELQLAPSACGPWLDRFVAGGLLAAHDDGVRFAADSAAAGAAVELVALYAQRRTAVIAAIYNGSS